MKHFVPQSTLNEMESCENESCFYNMCAHPSNYLHSSNHLSRDGALCKTQAQRDTVINRSPLLLTRAWGKTMNATLPSVPSCSLQLWVAHRYPASLKLVGLNADSCKAVASHSCDPSGKVTHQTTGFAPGQISSFQLAPCYCCYTARSSAVGLFKASSGKTKNKTKQNKLPW